MPIFIDATKEIVNSEKSKTVIIGCLHKHPKLSISWNTDGESIRNASRSLTLIVRDYLQSGFDLILSERADIRNEKVLYIGYWNDGC